MLNQMFCREISSKQDMEKFDREWMKICDEKDVTFYPHHPNSKRYFILDEKGNDVGTIEFTKRDPEVFTVCEHYFDFANHPKVSKNKNDIIEVGKICIFKESRRERHVDKILYLLIHFADENDVKQYLGYMNKEFLLVLLMCYGVRMERLGKEIVQTKHIGVPVLCDIEQQAHRLATKKVFDSSFFTNFQNKYLI